MQQLKWLDAGNTILQVETAPNTYRIIEAGNPDWPTLSAREDIAPYTPEPPEPITMADVEAGLQRFVDSTARQRSYRSGDACASYALSTVQQWKDEALAFISWRDSVWLAAFSLSPEDDIESVHQVVSTMPAMVWPEA